MGQWILPGPDASVMAKSDVAALLRVSEKTLDRMVTTGRFPCGIKVSPGSEPIWFGQDIAAWMHLSNRMATVPPTTTTTKTDEGD